MNDKKKITVSVAVITYKHESYIKECLDSIVSQKGDFNLEVIIREDCGNDGTLEICKSYQSKYPGIIKLLDSDKNLGGMPNLIKVLKATTGDFVAICEGDDFWIDEYKLQKQLEFMKIHTDYSMCFHNANIVYEGLYHGRDLFIEKSERTTFTTSDIISEFFIPTASIFYVRSKLDIPDWLSRVYNGDYGICLLLSMKGNIGYIDIIASVYRKNIGGLSGKANSLNITTRILQLLWYFDAHTEGDFYPSILNRSHQLNNEIRRFAFSERSRKAKALDLSFWLFWLNKRIKR